MKKTEVRGGELVVPREVAAVVLDLVDEALHQLALFVRMSILLPRHIAVGSGRDDGTLIQICPGSDQLTGST